MYKAGISYDRFGKLTLKEINIISNAYKKKVDSDFEYEDLVAHLNGIYMMEAIKCTVGNMFGKNGFKYPEKPLIQTNKPLTEKEKKKQVELFFAQIEAMGTNFNMQKKEEQLKSEDKG